jgi:2-keto-4-pentenoate hydratase/2-oxohepta-3-ene-1,7-dioic acid hydratase in catechol pathway
MKAQPYWFYPKLSFGDRVESFQFPTSKVVCIGRNYVAHAKELNNPVPSEPLLFIKPNSCLVDFETPINLQHLAEPCHFEAELAILIGNPLSNATAEQAEKAIYGLGLALDLTLRGMQQRLKSQGHPWEKAKSFNNACPVTSFVLKPAHIDWKAIEFSLHINDSERQHGQTEHMIVSVIDLIVEASNYFILLPGDIVLTGTPAGVGQLQLSDKLRLSLKTQPRDSTMQLNYSWQSVVNPND